MEDYIYLYLNADDDGKKIVAYSYITKTFVEYNGDGYVQHQALQHDFIFYKNSPQPDSLTQFFAVYTATSGSYVSEMAPNHQPGYNPMVGRGKPGTTYFFTDNEHVVDNTWRHDMWGFDTRFGDLVHSSYNYDYVCQNRIQTYGVEAGSSIAVNSYRNCITGELTYIVYKGNTNSFQAALEEGLYYPTCGTNAHAHCGGEVFGASDCEYIWFFDAEGWLGNKAALPDTVDGFTNPAPQGFYDTWAVGECKRVYDSTVHIYSFNQINNDVVHSFTFESALTPAVYDSTNVGGVMSNNIGGPYILYLYSPVLDTWSSVDFGTSVSDIGRGVLRDFIYWYDTEVSGPMNIFDGVTDAQISLPFGCAYTSTANSRKYTRSNFMLAP